MRRPAQYGAGLRSLGLAWRGLSSEEDLKPQETSFRHEHPWAEPVVSFTGHRPGCRLHPWG